MAIHYIDPVDGSDATGDDTNINTPRQTWPTTFTTGDTYAGKAGTIASWTNKRDTSSNNVTFTSYGVGQHKIDCTAQSTDTGRNLVIRGSGCVFDNLEITHPASGTGNGHCIQVASTGSDFTVSGGAVFTGPSTPIDKSNNAIDYQGDGPFDLGNFTINGFNVGVQVLDAAATGKGLIHDATITLNGHANQAGTGAGVFMVTTTTIDWNYNLRIYNITTTGWGENGIDLAGVSNAIVENCDISSPSGDIASPAGLFLGATTNAAIGHIVRNCYIHDMTIGTGINTRGGVSCEVYSNIFENLVTALYIGNTGSDDNVFYNNTIKNCTVGIDNQDSNTGTIFNNNIVSGCTTTVKRVTGDITYSNNCLFGGNIFGTPIDGGGNITTDPLLDADYYPHLDSPCIGAGCWTGAIRLDYGGRPFKRSKPTIGIWEIANRDPTNRTARE